MERTEILRDLRLGVFDVLVGINLLREGLDIPEVTLVAITDADKEGFLRSERSLIQTIGRAARNVEGRVILYADKMTDSMQKAISETNRRRGIQEAYNIEHGITPATIKKKIRESLSDIYHSSEPAAPLPGSKKMSAVAAAKKDYMIDPAQAEKQIIKLRKDMKKASANLNFEDAAKIRDDIKRLELIAMSLMSGPVEEESNKAIESE